MRYASKTNIKISPHAMQRIKERTELSARNDIMKYISQARYYGIQIHLLNHTNYFNFGIPENLFIYLKKHLYNYASDRLILYRDNIFCFTGAKDRTLKTIMVVPKNYIGWWKNGKT